MHPNAPEISAAVARILADADADIAARRPVCQSSGRCCKFESYGHSLFVTAAELLHFQTWHGRPANVPSAEATPTNTGETPVPRISLPQFFAQPQPTGCPYQINNLCTAREARPLGCRLYFCDENAQSWQPELYEKYHARLQALHESHNLPYRYLEWRQALKELL